MLSISHDADLENRLPRTRQIILVLIVAGLLMLVVLVSMMFHTRDPDLKEKPPVPGVFEATPDQYAGLQIEAVHQGTVSASVDATGVIAADDYRSTPILPPLSGQITAVLAEAGQRVVRGQALAVIRSSERSQARQTLLTASAQRDTAHSQLQIATANAHRQELIFKNGGGAQRDFQQSQTDLVSAQASVRTAEAAYAAAEDQLRIQGSTASDLDRANGTAGEALATVRAPIDGVIATRSASVGQFLGSNNDTPIFVITNPATVWLVAQVAESEATHIHVGDALDVTTPSSPGRIFSAKVSVVGSGLDPATHRLPVRAVIANPDGALKPQMFANFVIKPHASGIQNPFIISVPAEAVIREGDEARVWVVEPGRRLIARTVQISDGADTATVNVVSGLKPGERIVTRGAIFVNEAGIPG